MITKSEILLGLCLIVVIFGSTYSQVVQILESFPNSSVWFNTRSINFVNGTNGTANYTVTVNPSIKYQTMDGFGASLTEASCNLITNNLTPSKRQEVLNNLFSPQGINLGLLRQRMGLSIPASTYDDTVNNVDDYLLSNFSFAIEDSIVRPVLNQALQISAGRIKLFGTPWSPPAWMKTGKSLYGQWGGTLRKEPNVYDAYARYFVKYIKGYQQKNSSVYAVTIQNEPLYGPCCYPGMKMNATDQADFIRDYLGPAFKANNITTKIVAYDHNYDTAGYNYSVYVLNNTGNYCNGAAFHTYTYINHGAMTQVHNLFPNKDVWITEAGSGTWVGSGTTKGMFQDQIMHTIRSPRNWAKGVIFWNVALSNPPNDPNRGLITILANTTDSVTYETSYYSLGHSSKFLANNAVRIDSKSYTDNLENVAYLNPDQSIVVVMSNRGNVTRTVKVVWSSKSFIYTIQPFGAATFNWKSF